MGVRDHSDGGKTSLQAPLLSQTIHLQIFSAKQPYHDLANDAAVLIYVTRRHGRLKYDDYKLDMKQSLWSVLEKCWKQNSGERPSMDNVKGFVDKKRGSL